MEEGELIVENQELKRKERTKEYLKLNFITPIERKLDLLNYYIQHSKDLGFISKVLVN